MPDVFGEIVPDVGKVEKVIVPVTGKVKKMVHILYIIYMRYIY